MSNLPLLEEDLAFIAKLDDEPNDVGGMTAAELKDTFDKASLIIQAYINGKLVPAIEGYAVPGAGDFRADGNVPMAGNLKMGSHRIVELADPEAETDATNKKYVDAAAKVSADDLMSHADNKDNPHEVASSQVSISETAAAEVGLQHPSMVEDALRLLANGLGGVKNILNGNGPKYQWDMMQWKMNVELKSAASATHDYLNSLERRWSFAITQDAETGELSLKAPTVGSFPAEKTGMYFQAHQAGTSDWGPVYQWTENTSSSTTHHYSEGGETPDGVATVPYDYYVTTFKNVNLLTPLFQCIGSVSSDIEGAYPDGEWVDGVLYQLSAYDVGVARIAHGSYVGTGEKGATAPNSLSFSFEPKLVLVALEDESDSSPFSSWEIFLRNRSRAIAHLANYSSSLAWDGNTVSWYASSAAYQLNTEGSTYLYIAIG